MNSGASCVDEIRSIPHTQKLELFGHGNSDDDEKSGIIRTKDIMKNTLMQLIITKKKGKKVRLLSLGLQENGFGKPNIGNFFF